MLYKFFKEILIEANSEEEAIRRVPKDFVLKETIDFDGEENDLECTQIDSDGEYVGKEYTDLD